MACLLLTCFLSGVNNVNILSSHSHQTHGNHVIPPSLILPVFSLSPCALILPQICPVSLSASTKFIIISEFLCKVWSLHHPLQIPPVYSLCSNQCDFFPQKQNLVMSHCCLNSSGSPFAFNKVGWRGKLHYSNDL